MAGVDHAARGQVLEEYVEVMKQAWTGEPFEWQGRTVVVTPRPATEPHPMVFVGGGVAAAARRAARLRLPMLPDEHRPVRCATPYFEECERRSATRGFLIAPTGPTFVHVTEDPDKAWDADRPVRAVRSADVHVVPDARSALDARRARRDRSTT